jgi:NhaP-type Na+/H+ or K+/H+ antiporter
MNDINVTLTAVGGLVLLLGLLSRPVDRSLLSSPLLAFCLGAVFSPYGFALLDPAQWGAPLHLIEQAARLTLGFSLMGIALRLPTRFIFRQWRPLAILLVIGMPAMFLVSSLISAWTLGLPLLMALLVGACVCATDPVIASSIVAGGVAKENLPADFRHLLSAESGANDGLAYPLVLLPMLLMAHPPETAWFDWFVKTWLWDVLGSVLIGALIGWGSGRAREWTQRKGWLDQPSLLSLPLALTILVLGVGKLLGTDSILAVFAAGIAYDQVAGGEDRSEADNVQEAVNMFFTLPVFGLFGLMAPWAKWAALGRGGVLLVVLILLFRRLPVVLAMRRWLPPVREPAISWFMGWFGPIGVSALFYGAMATERTGSEAPWVVASLVVFASIIAHGVTAAPFTKRYRAAHDRPAHGG